jgi:hypothetical protein
MFDTSLLHEAANSADSVRYILMLRVWHPELSKDEVPYTYLHMLHLHMLHLHMLHLHMLHLHMLHLHMLHLHMLHLYLFLMGRPPPRATCLLII